MCEAWKSDCKMWRSELGLCNVMHLFYSFVESFLNVKFWGVRVVFDTHMSYVCMYVRTYVNDLCMRVRAWVQACAHATFVIARNVTAYMFRS